MKRVLSILGALVLIGGLAGRPANNAQALNQSAPMQVWVSVLANTANVYSAVSSMVTDSNENVYVTGRSTGTWGSPVRSHYAGDDVFVAKFDRNKNLIWNTFLGGAGTEAANSISLDAGGNVYISGVGTANWEPQASLVPLGAFGGHPYSAFAAKLDSNGNLLWYGFPLSGYNTYGYGVATDANGNAYMAGVVVSAIGASEDAFVLKLNTNGAFQWGKTLGGSSSDYGYKLALKGSGEIVMVGESFSTWGSPLRPHSGQHDIFVATLGAAQGDTKWNTFLGGAGDDLGFTLALDDDGSIFVGGRSYASWGTPILPYMGSDDAIIARLTPAGALVWHSFLGSARSDEGWDIAVDNGIIYFCGASSVSWGTPVWAHATSGGDDAFVASMDGNGNLQWHGFFGNGGDDECLAIESGGAGSLYYGGFIASPITDSGYVTRLSFQAGTFADVPVYHPYYEDIEILSANGLTAGCTTSPLKFCPDQIMDRAQSAVFMLRGNFGTGYTPPAGPWDRFADNWSAGDWAEKWAEGMYNAGLTAGCTTSPLKFCPWDQTAREQAAVFGLKLKYGNNYTPPPASGTVFTDMTDLSYWGTKWAEQAYADGLIPGCGTSGGKPMFCPKVLVSRGLGSHIIVRAKNLTLP